MKISKVSDLAVVTEATFQKELQHLKPVLDAEAKVQQQLAQLNALVRQSCAEETQDYLLTGADVLWNGWEAKTRRQLNMDLARAKARKLAALDQLRNAFGRQQAVAELSRLQLAERRQRSRNKAS